jgi:diguanylate cyclase (GGDEF)-like protein
MDVPARFGGDEFEIILPRTDRAGALIYAEKLRKTIEDMELSVSPDIAVHASISVGVATYPQNAETVTELQNAADKALYVSKEKGRNAVTAYSDETGKKERRTAR